MWAIKLAKRRDEILSENPDMNITMALHQAYEELKENA